MTRLLLLVGTATAAVAGFLVWLASRDLREPWVWPVTPVEDDVQSDPYLVSHPIGGM